MRFHPPFHPCDNTVCLNLAEHEIIREDLSGVAVLIARACGWCMAALYAETIRVYLADEAHPIARGFYTQRYVC